MVNGTGHNLLGITVLASAPSAANGYPQNMTEPSHKSISTHKMEQTAIHQQRPSLPTQLD